MRDWWSQLEMPFVWILQTLLMHLPTNTSLRWVQMVGLWIHYRIKLLRLSIVTFVKMTVSSAEMTWLADRAALVISLPHGVMVGTNDLGGQHHKKVATLRIPHICVKALLTLSNGMTHWWEAAEVTTSVDLDFYSSPRGYHKLNQDQIIFLQEQDRSTGRVRNMLSPPVVKAIHRSRHSIPHSPIHLLISNRRKNTT